VFDSFTFDIYLETKTTIVFEKRSNSHSKTWIAVILTCICCTGPRALHEVRVPSPVISILATYVTDHQGNSRYLESDESPTFVETYKEMEKLLDTGKVKSIGVSNFSIKTLSVLLPECKIVPAVNQVEMHPCLPQEELKALCEAKGILLTAYSPFGTSVFFFSRAVVHLIGLDITRSIGHLFRTPCRE
jgi:hypothetical protein